MEQFILSSAASGFDVTVVTFRASKAVEAVASVRRVPPIGGPFVIRFLWFWFFTTVVMRTKYANSIACGAITGARVDAVWMHFWHADHLRSTGWVCAWQGSLLGFINQSLARLIALLAEAWTLGSSRPTLLIAVSESMAVALRSRVKGHRIATLANPVSFTALAPSHEKSPGEPTVLFVGGEWGRKGLLLIAKAASDVGRSRQSPVHLIVVGRGPAKVLRRVRKLPFVQLEHVAWSDNVASFFPRADVFALASSYETFAMAGHEALAAGIPVISTNVYGLGDAVRGTKLGVVVLRRRAQFARAIQNEIASPTSAVARAEGQAWVVGHYGEETIERQRSHVRNLVTRDE